ncbi:MAG: hypothetical protein H7A32_02855 [Deltaproteobacteria bacterium]|nr:hypothetical protein [Deltaproteobacteria bacterium]
MTTEKKQPEIPELFEKALNGEILSENEQNQLEDLKKSSPEYQEMWEDLKVLQRELRNLPQNNSTQDNQVSELTRARIFKAAQQAIENETLQKEKGQVKKQWFKPFSLVAAMAVLVIGVTYFSTYLNQEKQKDSMYSFNFEEAPQNTASPATTKTKSRSELDKETQPSQIHEKEDESSLRTSKLDLDQEEKAPLKNEIQPRQGLFKKENKKEKRLPQNIEKQNNQETFADLARSDEVMQKESAGSIATNATTPLYPAASPQGVHSTKKTERTTPQQDIPMEAAAPPQEKPLIKQTEIFDVAKVTEKTEKHPQEAPPSGTRLSEPSISGEMKGSGTAKTSNEEKKLSSREKLIKSARKKIEIGKYQEAYQDLLKAKKIKTDKKIEDLMKLCQGKIKEIENKNQNPPGTEDPAEKNQSN